MPNRARIETGAGKIKLDLRADGGYVIAPGSIHASGAEYREAGNWTDPRIRCRGFGPGGWRDPPRAVCRGPRWSGPPAMSLNARVSRI